MTENLVLIYISNDSVGRWAGVILASVASELPPGVCLQVRNFGRIHIMFPPMNSQLWGHISDGLSTGNTAQHCSHQLEISSFLGVQGYYAPHCPVWLCSPLYSSWIITSPALMSRMRSAVIFGNRVGFCRQTVAQIAVCVLSEDGWLFELPLGYCWAFHFPGERLIRTLVAHRLWAAAAPSFWLRLAT